MRNPLMPKSHDIASPEGLQSRYDGSTINAPVMQASPSWAPAAIAISVFLLLASGTFIYSPGIRVPYFGDEYRYMFQGWPLQWMYFFTHRDGDPHGFRPLSNIVLAFVQKYAGWETSDLHVMALVLHFCLCGLVLVAARRLKFSMLQAIVAAVFAIFWQFAVSSILNVGRFSQLESTFFGSASMVALLFAQTRATRARRVALQTTSVLCYVVAAFSKETSGGFLLVIIFYLLYVSRPVRGNVPQWAIQSGIRIAPYILVEVVYFILRIHVGATSASQVYAFHANLIRNLVLFGVSAVTPLSSVVAMAAIHDRDLLVIGVVLALSGLTTLLVIAGSLKGGSKPLPVALLVLAIVALAPVIPVRQVSELYMYGAMPFLALLFGFGVGALLEKRNWRVAVGGFLALWMALNAQAVYSKAKMLDANGRRAMAMIEVIRRLLPQVPENGRILLAYLPAASDYSIFRVSGFGVLIVGNSFVGPLLGRPDVSVDLVSPANAQGLAADVRNFVFTFEDGKMRGPQNRPDPISDAAIAPIAVITQ